MMLTISFAAKGAYPAFLPASWCRERYRRSLCSQPQIFRAAIMTKSSLCGHTPWSVCRDSCSTWMAGMEAEANGHLEAAVERYTASLQGLDSAGEVAVPCLHSCSLSHMVSGVKETVFCDASMCTQMCSDAELALQAICQ